MKFYKIKRSMWRRRWNVYLIGSWIAAFSVERVAEEFVQELETKALRDAPAAARWLLAKHDLI